MALTRTAQQLEAHARRRADMVGSNFRASAAWYAELSASCRRLVGKLSKLDDYWTASTTVSTVANTRTSDFPAGAWKLLSLWVTLDSERSRITKAQVDHIDREVTPLGWLAGTRPKYRLRGESIVWVPTPTAVHVVTVEYLPTAIFKNAAADPITELANASDTFDGVFGWDEWVAVQTAIKMRGDAGKDVSTLRAELVELESALLLEADDRDDEEPERIRDIWDGGSEVLE